LNNKLNEVLSDYKSRLERKQRRIEKLHKKKFESELLPNEEQTLTTLEAESNLLKEVIEDLEYVGN
jgi:putative methionine-R-sulfoxide reductase with GAF domain